MKYKFKIFFSKTFLINQLKNMTKLACLIQFVHLIGSFTQIPLFHPKRHYYRFLLALASSIRSQIYSWEG